MVGSSAGDRISMGYGMTKAERIQEMEGLSFQRGYSDIETAERLGVDRL